MPRNRSISQERTASARRLKAAATPRARAMTALTQAVRAPMRMDRDSPARVRESISRPSQSVPNSPSGPGARFVREKSAAVARSVKSAPDTVTASRITAVSSSSPKARCRRFQVFIAGPPPS